LFGSRFATRALAASLLVGVGIGGFLLGSGSERQRMPGIDQGPSGPATITRQAAALPQPEIPPPAVPVAKSSEPRPSAGQTGPPEPSLRLRFGQWRDTPPAGGEEGGRR
jgi:hypothetical protein